VKETWTTTERACSSSCSVATGGVEALGEAVVDRIHQPALPGQGALPARPLERFLEVILRGHGGVRRVPAAGSAQRLVDHSEALGDLPGAGEAFRQCGEKQRQSAACP
jgi:hypothetical protein